MAFKKHRRNLGENRVYKLNLGAITAKDGSKMANGFAWYTLNRLKD